LRLRWNHLTRIAKIVTALQTAYREAISLWMKVGGTGPERVHIPAVIAAKKDLDQVWNQLIHHRQHHGC
jgi:hypothetical protein